MKLLRDLDKPLNIFLSTNSVAFKIEKDIPLDEYGQKFGWRILISLDEPYQALPNEVFKLPIKINKGKVLNFYDLYLDPLRKPQAQPQSQQQGPPPHPTIMGLYTFIQDKIGNNPKYYDSLSELLKKNWMNKRGVKQKWAVLRANEFEGAPFPFDQNQVYVNPKEADLLELVDLKNVAFEKPKLSSTEKDEINKTLSKMGFDNDLVEGSEQTIRELIEINSGIRDILNGKIPDVSGMALYGPPGTGKTYSFDTYLRSIFEEVLGYKWEIVTMSDLMSNQYVGGFSRSIKEQIFQPAIEYIQQNRKPYFVFVDEATSLLERGDDRYEWIKEGIETMKSFINRKLYPGIIVCLASNMERSKMDDALTREGRLKAIYIPLPSRERSLSLWKFVNSEFLRGELTNDQIDRLILVTQDKINVASVTGFSEKYFQNFKVDSLVFDDFLRRFGDYVLKFVNDEMQKEVSKLTSSSGMRFVDPQEVEREKQELQRTFQQRVYEIRRALDPSTPSSHEVIEENLVQAEQDRKNIGIFYKSYQEEITALTNLFRANDYFTDENKRLYSLLIEAGNRLYAVVSGTNEDFGNTLNSINQILSVLLETSQNPHQVSSFGTEEYSQLISLFSSLPTLKEVKKEFGTPRFSWTSKLFGN